MANLNTTNPLINKKITNDKAVLFSLTKTDTYYDLAFFLNCMFLGLDRTSRTSHPDVPFPKDLKRFYKTSLQEAVHAGAVATVLDDAFTYRLDSKFLVPDKIERVMKIAMETIFSGFSSGPTVGTKIVETFRVS
jgi:hypothetical protein